MGENSSSLSVTFSACVAPSVNVTVVFVGALTRLGALHQYMRASCCIHLTE